MILKNHLKELRARHGLNQSELADRADVSRQTISLIERGNYSPSITLALTLARILEVRVEEVFELQEEEDS
ncbi:DNA-binding helix-turn-helix protein [[Clostridium] methylpentosum DSM 5476]|jgi:putative transcriptional regulator|uniref:DNA-binding helix-turn-helix protein n=1 Tax=[Clostridium] methylpentosum DSM 5476 TaxID=537013 RepID=C0ECT9_9FIRM|nr:DNA-binding helix-turn-helix protein [[Clostridium] methylpentosum DSM 5476]MDY3989724.1 helix-turn-helix transcriptional regulator [Massilioclostridium sp.]MEE1491332.1 helix-turn-helix transcriptional regulator [Massilioclostridium sp.]